MGGHRRLGPPGDLSVAGRTHQPGPGTISRAAATRGGETQSWACDCDLAGDRSYPLTTAQVGRIVGMTTKDSGQHRSRRAAHHYGWCGSSDRGRTRRSAAVGVPAVVDVQDVDLVVGIVDAVSDPVLPTARPPESDEGRLYWRADSARPPQQGTVDELPGGKRCSRRQRLAERAPCTWSHDQPIRLRLGGILLRAGVIMRSVHVPCAAPSMRPSHRSWRPDRARCRPRPA